MFNRLRDQLILICFNGELYRLRCHFCGGRSPIIRKQFEAEDMKLLGWRWFNVEWQLGKWLAVVICPKCHADRMIRGRRNG